MGDTQKLDTYRKALTLNLDPSTFGSFAEIGAGQEVARWFLVVGGASGTVAKAISAYDKEVSDDLYGSGSPYVSKQRLQGQANAGTTRLLPAVIPDHIRAPLNFFRKASASYRNGFGTHRTYRPVTCVFGGYTDSAVPLLWAHSE